jgi:hypothetical protein
MNLLKCVRCSGVGYLSDIQCTACCGTGRQLGRKLPGEKYYKPRNRKGEFYEEDMDLDELMRVNNDGDRRMADRRRG